jgi:shikimate kinase
MMRFQRIYLVGFMGAGKSRIGADLAERLGWSFIDMDSVIERIEKMAIRDIFAQFGEAHFRSLERRHMKELSTTFQSVIALGGGAYVDPENRRVADETGITVWLKVSFDNVVHRVTMDGTRPMFASAEQVRKLLEDRLPAYSLARIHVLTDGREPAAIVGEILERLEKV